MGLEITPIMKNFDGPWIFQGGDPFSWEMNPSGPQISEKSLILLQLIAPFIGAPGFTRFNTLFPMYFDSPIDDRRLIGVWGGMRVETEN